MYLGVKKSIKDYCVRPKYERPERKAAIRKIPSMIYTSPESLAFIREKDKDVNSSYCKEIEAEVAHINTKTK